MSVRGGISQIVSGIERAVQTALFGPIPLTNISRYAVTKSASPIAHKTDVGFVMQQITQRDLERVTLSFRLVGEARYALKAALELAYARRQIMPFICEIKFLRSVFVTRLIMSKENTKKQEFGVEMDLDEVAQWALDEYLLYSDLAGYTTGVLLDILQDPDGAVTGGMSFLTGVVPRFTGADKTGHAVQEADPITESAKIATTDKDENGNTFQELVEEDV